MLAWIITKLCRLGRYSLFFHSWLLLLLTTILGIRRLIENRSMTRNETAFRILSWNIGICLSGSLVKLFLLRRNVRLFVPLIILAQILILWANYLRLNIEVIMLCDVIIIQLRHTWTLDQVSFRRRNVPALIIFLNIIICVIHSAADIIKHIDVWLLNFEGSSVVQLLIGLHPRGRRYLQLNVKWLILNMLWILFRSLSLGLMKLDYLLLVLV